MRHSIHSIFFDQAAEHEAHERYDEALNLLYQVHRWAAEDPELWLRMGVLSFLMTDRGWLARVGKTDAHLADMGTVNARLYLAEARARGEGPRFAFWEGWVRHALYQDAAGAPAVAHPAAGHLEQGVAQSEGREHPAHLHVAECEVAADVAAGPHDADAVEVGDQRQRAGEAQDAEARAAGDEDGGGGGGAHNGRL